MMMMMKGKKELRIIIWLEKVKLKREYNHQRGCLLTVAILTILSTSNSIPFTQPALANNTKNSQLRSATLTNIHNNLTSIIGNTEPPYAQTGRKITKILNDFFEVSIPNDDFNYSRIIITFIEILIYKTLTLTLISKI